MTRFTPEQRLWVHGQKVHHKTPYRTMKTLYRAKFGSNPPSRNGYNRISTTVETCSTLTDLQRPGRPRTATTEEETFLALDSVMETPKLGIRRRAASLDQTRSSLHRILKDLKQYPYRLRKLHELKEPDYNNRLLFSNWFLEQCEADSHFEDLVLYTDEAHCELSGTINSHNAVYWGTQRPTEVLQSPLHSPKVTIWCAISSSGLIGPYFFEDQSGATVTVDGARYKRLLSHTFYPDLMNFTFSRPEENHLFAPPDSTPNNPPHRWWFMQDGARPHLPARRWISSKFGDNTIGEGLANPWPARSPDLTPCDFFLWGWLKESIYRDGPIATIPELKRRIIDSCDSCPLDFITRACRSVKKRCRLVMDANGGHIENFM